LDLQVYRYFADNCTDQFPQVDTAPALNLTHVVCEERYSGVAPSTEGEVSHSLMISNHIVSDTYDQTYRFILKLLR